MTNGSSPPRINTSITNRCDEAMKPENLPPTEIGKKRDAGFKGRVKPGMTFEEAVRLNDEALRLFPVSEEERRLKTECLMAMPEFVL